MTTIIRQQHPVRTSTLLRRLFKTANLKSFVEQELPPVRLPTLPAYLQVLCREQGKPAERIINCAGIERTYGHQLFSGIRQPSRDKVIQLAFGFQLDVDGAQHLLRIAKKNALYPKFDRDAVILYCLNQRMSVIATQSMLQELGLTLLGGDEKRG